MKYKMIKEKGLFTATTRLKEHVTKPIKETMNTKLKEMRFCELKAQIEDFNHQIMDIKSKMEEMISERQNRKDEAIKNWKLHKNQLEEFTKAVMEATYSVVEDTKVLLNMGIDPHSLDVVQ